MGWLSDWYWIHARDQRNVSAILRFCFCHRFV